MRFDKDCGIMYGGHSFEFKNTESNAMIKRFVFRNKKSYIRYVDTE